MSDGPTIKIAPSILSAKFEKLGEEITDVERGGAEWIHVDVMDGRFVPNITIGPLVVEAARRVTELPLDVHLMIVEPENYIAEFAAAGADRIGVHVETCPHLHRTIQQIHDAPPAEGRPPVKACVVLNPSTPASAVEPVLEDLDQILVMSVNPGFGGQSFIDSQLAKLETLRGWIDARKPEVELQVDGGIKPDTIVRAAEAGANAFVAGSAVYNKKDRAAAIAELKEGAKKGWAARSARS